MLKLWLLCCSSDMKFIQPTLLKKLTRNGRNFVKKVTTAQIVYDAMNTNEIHKSALSEVHKLYLTLSVTSSTAEQPSSDIEASHITTFNYYKKNFMLLHIHDIAKEFLSIDTFIHVANYAFH